MNNPDNKTKEQLLKEIDQLRAKIAEQEKSETDRLYAEQAGKHAEKKLRESEEKFSRAFHNSPIPIYITIIPDGVFIDVNHMVEEISGFKRDEMIGKTGQELGFYENPEKRDKMIQQLQKDGKLHDHEMIFQIKSGENRFCRLYSEILEIQGKPHVLSMVIDVTERKQAEDALKESEERFRLLSESTYEGIVITDKGRICEANIQLAEMLKIKHNELIGMNVNDFVAHESRELVDQNIQSGTEEPYEHFAKKNDGSIFPVEIRAKSLPLEGKNLKVTVIRDITERKRADEALKNSEEKLKILFESAPDAYYLSDLNGVFIDGNKAAEILMGYTKKELIGKSFFKLKLLSVNELLKASKVLVKNVQGKGTGPDEFILHRKDGSKIPVEITTHPVIIKDKTVVLGIARDISERKQVENELRKSEKKFSSIVESSPMGMHLFSLEPDGKLIFNGANPAAKELLGIDFSRFIGNTIEEAFPPLSDTKIPEIYRKVASHGKMWQTEYVVYKDEKISRVLDIYAFQTTPGKMVALFMDITKRKQAEERIRFLSSVVEQSAEGMAITNLDENLLYANDSWVSMHGYEKKEELIGKNLSIFHNKEQLKNDVEPFNQKVLEKGSHSGEIGHIHRDGTPFPTHMTSTIIKDEQGKVIGIAGIATNITERKQAELELRQSEERFKRLFEKLGDAVYVTKVGGANQGRILEVNSAAVKQTGYTRNELLKMNIIKDLHISGSGEIKKDDWEDMLYKGETVITTEKKKRKDGKAFWTEVIVTLIDFKGEKASLSINHDITHRKKMEEALKLTQFTVDNSKDAVYWMGKDAKFIYVNNAAVEALGYSKEELLTMNVHDIGPEFPVEAWPAHWAELKEKISFILHTIHQRKDKSTFPVEITVNFVRFGDKEINCAIAKDITERKQVEKTIKESEEKYRKIFDEFQDLYYKTDLKGVIRDMSPSIKKLSGYEREELIGKPVSEVFKNKIDRINFLKVFKKTGDIEDYEITLLGKDGREIIASATSHILYDKNKPIGIEGVLRDITQRKQAEEELKAERTSLSKKVKERTADLSKVNAELAKASKTKDQFLANMSHELRTPLNSIIGLSHVLAKQTKDKLSEEESNYLEIVERNGKRLLLLINDILDLSKIVAGKMEIFLEFISVGIILQIIKENMQTIAEEKGLTLTLSVPDNFPKVENDESKLTQILTNVIGNAVKYTWKGGVDILVKHDSENIFIEVKDSGIGISNELLPHIFDEFRQADSSVTRQYEGTGLGLAIAKKMIIPLGGDIEVKSELDKGSVFTIIVPIKWAGEK